MNQYLRRDMEPMMSDLSAIFASLLLLSSLLLLLLLHKQKQRNQYPPGPPGFPIIGNLHQLGTFPHKSLHRLSKTYGPLMSIHLGRVPALIVSSSEAAREVLTQHEPDCCGRPPLTGTRKMSYNFNDLAFTSYGEYWKRMRKVATSNLFSLNRVQSFRPVREEEVALLLQSIAETSNRGEAVNLSEKLMSLSADISYRSAFGKSFRREWFDAVTFEDMIHEAAEAVWSSTAANFLPYIGRIIDWITGIHGRLDKIFRKLDRLYQKVIDDHLQTGGMMEKQHEDLVDVLLKLCEDKKMNFGHDHIKAMLMDIFIGGVLTSSVTMVWAMSELARNPRVMKRAQEEIRDQLGSARKVCENDVDKLNYLKMVIKETLRLHPPAQFLPRASINQFKLHGYTIEPGTYIQVNVWAIGRDPAIWENAEEFYPERFLDNSIDMNGQHFELLAFGAGRRRCPGVSMATTSMEVILASLLYHFDWKLPSGMKEEDLDMAEEFAMSTRKKLPLKLLPVLFHNSCLAET